MSATTDRSSLCLQQYYELDNASTVCTTIYIRWDHFPPETLESAVAEKPNQTLFFYWRDQPAEGAEQLVPIPMTVLEKDRQNKLLLAGCWDETEIRLCTGRSELNADGTLQG